MTLAATTRSIAVAATAGFVALALLYVWAERAHAEQERRLHATLRLQDRADHLVAAATAIVVGTLDAPVVTDPVDDALQHLRDDAARLHVDVSTVVDADARRIGVNAALDRLVDAVVEAVHTAPSHGAERSGTVGPLGLSPDAALALRRVVDAGVELDAAVDAILGEDLGVRLERAHLATHVFALAALALAALGAITTMAYHRRIGAPLAELIAVTALIATGARGARARAPNDDEIGRLAASLNGMLDVLSERERALLDERAALELEREHLSASQRIAHVATWTWEPDAQRVRLSDEAYRIAGLEPGSGQVGIDDLLRVVHDEDRATVVDGVIGRLAQNQPASTTVRVVHPDGQVRTVRLQGEPQHRAGRRVALGTALDVTDETILQRAAAADARLLAAAGRVARLGGWSVDTRTWAMQWSDVVCEIHEVPCGTAPAPDRGIEFYAPEHQERIRRAFEACAHLGVPYDEELQIVTATGRRVWVRTTGTAVRDEHGTIVRVEGAFQDVDERRRAEAHADALERRLQQTLERLHDPFVLLDADGTIAFANGAAAGYAGIDRDTLTGRRATEVFASLLDDVDRRVIERRLKQGGLRAAEIHLPSRDRWIEVRVDRIDSMVALQARDVTERHELVERLREQERVVRDARDALEVALASQRAAFDALPANVAVLSPTGIIEHVNEGWRSFGARRGIAAEAAGVGTPYLDAVERAASGGDAQAAEAARGLRLVIEGDADAFDMEYPCHGPDAEAWFRMSARRIDASAGVGGGAGRGPRRVVVMHVDVTERMLAERALAFVAHHDPLTRLLSRVGLAAELGAALRRHWRPQGVVAVVDLVGFRGINDAHGYAVGDAVLREVADRLVAAVGDAGVAARVGGDSFAAFIEAGTLPEAAATEVQRLVQRVFGAPVAVADFTLTLDVALGYTRLGAEARDPEALLREAEVALYDGLHGVDGGVAAYTSELDAASRARTRTTSELKVALERAEFVLHYQPKVDLRSGHLVAAEALVRWQHPERGLVPPGSFVEIAEQSGLIVPIGAWVLGEACAALARWREAGFPGAQVAVNVSVRQLTQGDLAADVARLVERHAIDPSHLMLEITESVYVSESRHLRHQLHALHAMGVRLALDDFGTGFSSLQYLKSYRFDEVKIDRSFVRDMVRDAYSRNVVATILGIAHAIGADAVAEGVETERQRDVLVSMGCRFAQGYFFGAPVPEDDHRWLLAHTEPLPQR